MLNNLKVVFTVSVSQFTLLCISTSNSFLCDHYQKSWRLSKIKEVEVILETEQDDQSLSALRQWQCFTCPFFKSVCCLINLLMTFCCCLLYLLIATISSIYLTLYFLQTLSCQVFNPLWAQFGYWVCLGFFSHALLRLNLLLEYLFNFTTWFFPKQYFNSFFCLYLRILEIKTLAETKFI